MNDVKMESLTAQIDLRDSATITKYGSRLQKMVASLADNSVIETLSQTTAETKQLIAKIQTISQNLQDANEQKGFLGLFRGKRKRIRSPDEDTVITSAELEQIRNKLISNRTTLLVTIETLSDLEKRSVRYQQQLEAYIQAGKQKITEAQEETSVATDSAAEIDCEMQLQTGCQQLEERLQNLELSKTVCAQIQAQFRLETQTCRQSAAQIQSNLDHTLTLLQQLSVKTIKN